jgi:uncharacterized protein (TIGR02145 family)
MHHDLPKNHYYPFSFISIPSRYVLICTLIFIATHLYAPLSAQECTVTGGLLQATSATSGLCIKPGASTLVTFSVSGSQGAGKYGLADGASGNVLAVNTTGQFNMGNYPAGTYIAGYVAVESLATLDGITNVNQLSGCYSLSNTIAVSTQALNGGTVAALGADLVPGGVVSYAVSGAVGPNTRWVMLNAPGTVVIAINNTGTFSLDTLPDGSYKIAHIAFSGVINPSEVDPQNPGSCIAASNLLTVSKITGSDLYPSGSVFCEGKPAAVVEVTNPATGRTWMDRNLGASRVATTIYDQEAYGDLYQWGRLSDGHQCRNAPTTVQQSAGDIPGNGNFIVTNVNVLDWRATPNDNLWQGVNGVNNPCPTGFRLPTKNEWVEEIATWTENSAEGALASPLKLTAGRLKSLNSGTIFSIGNFGSYWTSTVEGIGVAGLYFDLESAGMGGSARANGVSVRCIKD